MSLYDDLGVDKNATDEELKKAYRNKSKKTHPDKEGGSEEEFQKVSHAYMVLSDASKRSRYDKTGDEEGMDRSADRLMGFIHSTMSEFLQTKNHKRDSLTDFCVNKLNDAQIQNHVQIRGIEEEIKKLEDVVSRLGGGANNPFVRVVQTNIDSNRRGIEQCKELIQFNDEILDSLKGYEYTVDEFDSNWINQRFEDKTGGLASNLLEGWSHGSH